jgi:hypothetical protein
MTRGSKLALASAAGLGPYAELPWIGAALAVVALALSILSRRPDHGAPAIGVPAASARGRTMTVDAR